MMARNREEGIAWEREEEEIEEKQQQRLEKINCKRERGKTN